MDIMTNSVYCFTVFALILFGHVINGDRSEWTIEQNASFWNQEARIEIERALQKKENTRIAKNVILFLGDGMGITTVTAGRIRKGQVNGRLGEDYLTEMERFPFTGFSKTYNIDYQTPDSAATATAFLCGVKAQLGTIGLDGRAKRANCPSSHGADVQSILDWAQEQKKKVGIVTTTRVTHATPSAGYAHSAERNWEGYDGANFNQTHFLQNCTDIAYQLVSRRSPLDLILGGGRQFFYPNTMPDVEYSDRRGSRIDNRSLIDEFWKGKYIWNMSQMNQFPLGSSEPLLGLFEPSHMRYESERSQSKDDEPSLSRMTEFAIEHFVKFDQGFVLLIEGGRIDHAHHDTFARRALDEFVEFDNAIGQAKKTLETKGVINDTLIVVTADHSHVFTFGAYGSRGSNILGYASLENTNVSDIDGLPVNIISYGNGPNFNLSRTKNASHWPDFNLTTYQAPAALPLAIESHGGEDVPVYASGPWSHLFIGTYEQHTIAHKMAYAACLGAYKDRDGCQKTSSSQRIVWQSISSIFVYVSLIYHLIFV